MVAILPRMVYDKITTVSYFITWQNNYRSYSVMWQTNYGSYFVTW